MATHTALTRATDEIPPVVLRPRDAARWLGISEATLWNWAARNPSFPKPIKLSAGITVWRIDELDSWMLRQPRVDVAEVETAEDGSE